jgi:hypothetical protein
LKQLTVTKQIDAPLDFAFSWLTDFQTDDMAIVGGKLGSRKVERISTREVHLRNNFLKTKYIEDMVVTICPPDHWDVRGRVLDKERLLASYTQKFRLEATPDKGSKMTMILETQPLTLVSRMYTFFRWGNTVREFSRQNDLIVAQLVSDYEVSL